MEVNNNNGITSEMRLQQLKTQQEQEKDLKIQILQEVIKFPLLQALDRTDSEPRNLERMIKDLATEFYFMKEADIIEAITKGSMGRYGRGFKFSTQEVGWWITQYLESKKSKLGI